VRGVKDLWLWEGVGKKPKGSVENKRISVIFRRAIPRRPHAAAVAGIGIAENSPDGSPRL